MAVTPSKPQQSYPAHEAQPPAIQILNSEVQRLKNLIRVMAEAWMDQTQERDAETLRLIHENEQLRMALKATRETERAE